MVSYVRHGSLTRDAGIAAAKSAVAQLGGRIAGSYDYTVPGTEVSHRVVIIEKIKPTPKAFPRAFAKIKRSPLI